MICEAPITRGPDKGRPATGTNAGYMRHWLTKENPCGKCQEARRQYLNEYRTANKQRLAAYRIEYSKANADRQAIRRRKHYLANRDRYIEQATAWRKANPDKHAEHAKRWRAGNPNVVAEGQRRRRARVNGVLTIGFTDEQLAQKMAYWGNRCWVCHDKATEVDHVKPISRGGPHILANLRPACRSCNAAKSDQWPLAEVA